LVAGVSGKAIPHFSRNWPRSHGVDANVLFGEFKSCRLGQSFDRLFGCDIDADSTTTDVAGYARGVDACAATVLDHHRNFVTHRVQKAPNVDVEDAPVLGFSNAIAVALPIPDLPPATNTTLSPNELLLLLISVSFWLVCCSMAGTGPEIALNTWALANQRMSAISRSYCVYSIVPAELCVDNVV